MKLSKDSIEQAIKKIQRNNKAKSEALNIKQEKIILEDWLCFEPCRLKPYKLKIYGQKSFKEL